MGGGRYGTIKWGDSVDSGLYESGTFMLSLGLDEIIQRVGRDEERRLGAETQRSPK